uniref:Uncharacterized protein n=1 Tax=Oryza sativa subsp. japonica TaxID=39947 RepID=Q69P52_ORYSJ|nr:hypothetical protein [Oryza sativa Japonica Group]
MAAWRRAAVGEGERRKGRHRWGGGGWGGAAALGAWLGGTEAGGGAWGRERWPAATEAVGAKEVAAGVGDLVAAPNTARRCPSADEDDDATERGGVGERARWRRGGGGCDAGGEAGADPEVEAEGDGVGERGGRWTPHWTSSSPSAPNLEGLAAKAGCLRPSPTGVPAILRDPDISGSAPLPPRVGHHRLHED